MEPYAKSVERVDLALQRLNATLASCQLSQRKSHGPGETKVSTHVNDPASDSSNSTPQLSALPSGMISAEIEQPASDNHEQIPGSHQVIWQNVVSLSRLSLTQSIAKGQYSSSVAKVIELQQVLLDDGYNLALHLLLAHCHLQIGYPDLAAGSAYKALLLSDAISDDSDEFHYEACDAFREVVSQQPLKERIAILKTELHAGLDASHEAHEDIHSNGPEADLPDECDVEMDVWLREHYLPMIYQALVSSLTLCGCFKTAYEFCTRGLRQFPGAAELQACHSGIIHAVAAQFGTSPEDFLTGEHSDHLTWPDSGLVRREKYTWNVYEPDRYSQLEELNEMMAQVAPKLEIRAVELPALDSNPDANQRTVTQLGVFAREDIQPGETVLDETSLLTANNKLQDALCDACSSELPDLRNRTASAATVSCTDCEVVFCSQTCHDRAMLAYHPALCERDVDAIAKDVPAVEAADALYSLLLLRALAMAETQDCHPLELKEVKHIWADFHNSVPVEEHWQPCRPESVDIEGLNSPSTSLLQPVLSADHNLPRTLPFSFEQNIRLPLHVLEKMDIDPFSAKSQTRYDIWVFNTLYAKFRGTASARFARAENDSRGTKGTDKSTDQQHAGKDVNSNVKSVNGDDKSGSDKAITTTKLVRRPRGPEVSAVHPMWCMANHSCDPNVSWEWGGSIRLWARPERVTWRKSNKNGDGNETECKEDDTRDGREEGSRQRLVKNHAGIRKGEEILNHYCDVGLSVQDRRDWARGALGGDCMCERCVWEST